MYGSQPEIQRIQTKLRQIGQNHPYRVSELSAEAIESERSSSAKGPETRSEPSLPPVMSHAQPHSQSRPYSPHSHPFGPNTSPVQPSTNQPSTNQPSTKMSQSHGTDQSSISPATRPTATRHLTHRYSVPHLLAPVIPDDMVVSSPPPRLSTAERYNSAAGRQARRAMAAAHPVAGIATQGTPSMNAGGPNSRLVPSMTTNKTAYQQADALATHLRQRYSTARSRRAGVRHQPFAPMSGAMPSSSPSAWVKVVSIMMQGWQYLQRQWHQDRKLSSSSTPIPASGRRFLLPQAIWWLLGAMIARLVIDGVLALYPSLLLFVMTVVLTPVAIALYQTAINPQGSVHSGRRLLIIMIGLLIGGQI